MMKGRNGQVKENKGDMMTSLLDSTESDVEWLNLPPIKGKKPKKKKAAIKPKDTSLCDTWTIMKGFLYIGVVGVVVLLTITSIWLSSQLNAVRQSLKEVESKGVVNSEDILKLQGVTIQLNKTLELEMRNSKLLLENITAINGTILKLSKSLGEIGEGIKAAPEIKQIPEKLKMFSTTLVEMGSDVSTLKEVVKSIDPFHKATTAKLDNLTKQIEDFKQAGKSESSTPPEALSPELANIMQAIPQKVEDLNFTLSGQIAVMMKSLSFYEEKFVQLENRTSSLAKSLSEIQGAHATIADEHSAMPGADFTSDQFKHAVTDIVQDLMGSNVSEISPALSSNRINDMVRNITELLQRMDNLEKSGGSDGADGELPDSLDSLRISLENELQAINSSLMNLRSDHNHVTGIVMDHSNSLVSIGHQVKMTLHFVYKLEQTLDLMQSQSQTPSATPPKSEVPEETHQITSGSVSLSPNGEVADQSIQSVTSPPNENGEEKPQPIKSSTQTVPQENMDNDEVVLNTETPKPLVGQTSTVSKMGTENLQSTEKVTQSRTENPSPAINIPSIQNAEDLKNKFSIWSRGYAVDQVSYADLENYLGPHIPDEEVLKRFDADGSGTYSLEEFSKALGIPLDDETDLPPIDKTIPPR